MELPESTYPAISEAVMVPSSTAVHGRHIQSDGARVVIFLTLGWSPVAFGQNKLTTASLSPLSWQHMQDRSVCHNLDPET